MESHQYTTQQMSHVGTIGRALQVNAQSQLHTSQCKNLKPPRLASVAASGKWAEMQSFQVLTLFWPVRYHTLDPNYKLP